MRWRKVCREGAQKRKAEKKVDEDSEENEIRSQIGQEVVACIKEKVSVHNGGKDVVQKPVVAQGYAKLELFSHRKLKERMKAGEKGTRLAAQWDEEQKLEEIVARRRMEGSSLQLEVMQKVLELVVQESMSQGKGMKGLKEKKEVQGWPFEDVKEKQNVWWKTLKK